MRLLASRIKRYCQAVEVKCVALGRLPDTKEDEEVQYLAGHTPLQVCMDKELAEGSIWAFLQVPRPVE